MFDRPILNPKFYLWMSLLLACNSSDFSSDGRVVETQGQDQTAKPPAEQDQTTDLPPNNLSYKISANPDIVKKGGKTVVRLILEGNPDRVEINGAEVTNYDNYQLPIAADTNVVAKIFSGTQSGECKVKVLALDDQTIFIKEKALCYGNKGAGRKLLVIADTVDEILDSTGVSQSLKDISANTGIAVTTYPTKVYVSDSFISQVDKVINHINSQTYDAIWYMAGCDSTPVNSSLVNAIKAKIALGVGLGLFGENDPCSIQIADLLTQLHSDWNLNLAGNYAGTRGVSKEGFPSDGLGKLLESPLTAGLFQKVSEGITIAQITPKAAGKPSIMTSPTFQRVLINTAGQLTTATVEQALAKNAAVYPRASKNTSGYPLQRTIIQGAFTNLEYTEESWAFNSKTSPGTPQFFSNMACWSSNVQ